ncbi:MAG TPA: periplasmic heavy metal sensor [Pyrinomonadaceae bacterium]|nr:periplasmic heavy metal sensor [Pyrinomonadaceae bacterium]
MKHTLQILTLMATLLLVGVVSAAGQAMQPQGAPPMPPQGRFGADPIRQLNLTPEQREQIRLLREANREERATINQRVRETNRALEEVLDTDSPDESVVEQRVREAAAAQAAAMRMRIVSEVKIRRVLTAEQRVLLKSLRKQAHEARGGERLEERQKRREDRSLRLREQRKLTGPLFRRPAAPKRPNP